MIIATAGHVDHGKTALVRALTGIDTDRLAEEQRRGMSIDLGFAHGLLPVASEVDAAGAGAEPLRCSFIDVPGHERFMRNMLAGMVAVDLALLVVAADDGVMPQTREHLAVLDLLAVPHLVVALSKADRVDAARLAAARAEVLALLADTAFAAAPVFVLSSATGAGLLALQQHLAAAARGLARRPVHGHFRLAVDRSFLLPGVGRVVAGTVLSGEVAVGDDIRVSPGGQLARVRSLQAQHSSAKQARAGQRCALALVGPALRQAPPQRGDWLLAPPAHRPTQRLDVQLRWLPGASAGSSPRARLQLHLGAAAVGARLQALDDWGAVPGQACWARLLLDQPVAATGGDRFILRNPAANQTLAGGVVVDPDPPPAGEPLAARQARLQALAQSDPAAALQSLQARAPQGVALAGFAQARNLRSDELRLLCQPLAMQQVTGEAGSLALSMDAWQVWQQRLLALLAQRHADQPECLGPDEADCRRGLGLAARPVAHQAAARSVLHAALAALVTSGEVGRQGLRHHLPGHVPQLAEADAALLQRLQPLLAPAGLRPPIVGELAAHLAIEQPVLVAGLQRLTQAGHLVQVAPNRWYLPPAVAQLWAHAQALAAASADGSLDAAGYRDATGIGRNLAVQVLEFLDREGLTRFDGRRHRPVNAAPRAAASVPDSGPC